MMRLLAAALLTCVLAWPAYADVTITLTVKGGMVGGGQTVYYIKGAKARIETTLAGRQNVMIVDPAARQMITLDPATREATVIDLGQLSQKMQESAGVSEPKVSVTPTGQTREILGQTCTEYQLTMTLVMNPPGGGPGGMTTTLTGPILIARDAPGSKDFVNFARAVAAGGLFVPSGGRGGAGNPQARSEAALYKALAEAGGIPYEQTLAVKMDASGPMANMMRGRGGMPSMTTTTTVTSVSTDPIPDDKFGIPAGYSRRNQ
jgi:hypothetical protein